MSCKCQKFYCHCHYSNLHERVKESKDWSLGLARPTFYSKLNKKDQNLFFKCCKNAKHPSIRFVYLAWTHSLLPSWQKVPESTSDAQVLKSFQCIKRLEVIKNLSELGSEWEEDLIKQICHVYLHYNINDELRLIHITAFSACVCADGCVAPQR